MGTDIYVYTQCAHCKETQCFNTENEGEAFEINDEEQWQLLRSAYRVEMEGLKGETREVIAQELKFDAEGVFNFFKCEKCKKFYAFYIYSY